MADSGEVVAVACNLGVAHPPGYPLYTLLGHAFCSLPFSTPAGRVGLLSVVAGVVSILALLGLVRRLTGNLMAGFFAALTLATGPIFWRHSSLAEVYTLNAALVLLTLYLSLRAKQAQSTAACKGWSALAGLFWGFSLSHHHSAIFIAPVVAVAVLVPAGALWRRLSRMLCAFAAFLFGLLPYLYLVVASPQRTPRWGHTETFDGFIQHVLRRDYGSLKISITGEASPFSTLGTFFKGLPEQLAWVFFPLLLWGVWQLLVPRGAELKLRAGRPMCWALVLSFLLAGPFFLSLFNIEAISLGRQEVERFFVLPIALFCIALGVAFASFDGWIRRIAEGSRLALYRGAIGGVLGLAALSSYAKADVRESFAVEDYAENVLRTVARDALILGTGDVRFFSLNYVQHVLGLRQDVQYVDLKMLLYPWYVEQQRRLYPRFDYTFQTGSVDSRRVVHSALAAGRPVYLANIFSARAKSFAAYPEGPLLHLVKPGQPSPA
ncbi:MAG: DUF2723 domain-containing protein, partial [Deltaproteobacteria bacterium]|nr:DUF2723 domain-containing protein [Deltaproteobacteria bacterium]